MKMLVHIIKIALFCIPRKYLIQETISRRDKNKQAIKAKAIKAKAVV